MKGISHFAVGVAVASCFPEAVEAGAAGNPLYFILGGVFGLLPDTLDFKFYRFLYRHDMEVRPDPLQPDPESIARAVAHAVEQAFATRKAYRIKLNTIRLGTDRWQRYTVTFDVPAQRVVVTYGAVVDTGGNTIEPAPPNAPSASARLPCGLRLDYQAQTNVDIFEGPLFSMVRLADGRVSPVFIPWHRQWTHSLLIGLLLALVPAWLWNPLAGMVALLAYAAHIGVDQLGHLGSNLFYPLQSQRSRGLGLAHSGEAFPNFSAVWLSCLLVFWNLSRIAEGVGSSFGIMKLLFYGAIVPLGVYWVAGKRPRASHEPI